MSKPREASPASYPGNPPSPALICPRRDGHSEPQGEPWNTNDENTPAKPRDISFKKVGYPPLGSPCLPDSVYSQPR